MAKTEQQELSVEKKVTTTFYKVPEQLMQVITQQLLKSNIVLQDGIQLINTIRNLETIIE